MEDEESTHKPQKVIKHGFPTHSKNEKSVTISNHEKMRESL